MGREKKPYTLYQRTMSNGRKLWSYRTYDKFGRRTAGKATGETSKTKAEIYCMELFKKDLLIPDSSLKLSAYTEVRKFFQYGECKYCAENGVHKTYADDCLSRMKNHVTPLLGNISFENITSQLVSAWQTELLTDKEKGLSVKTVRECRTVLNIILTTARQDGYLNKEVMQGVKKLPRQEKKERGILTEGQVRTLFDDSNFSEYWKNKSLYYVASYVACFTGMRQGEILALTPDKIFEKHIYVNASWGKNGLGPTKTKETRQVYLTANVREKLISIMPESGFIFSFKTDHSRPLKGQNLTGAFYYALEQMKVDRTIGNITFHSFRHWLVTYLRNKGVPESEIQKTTGHKTLAMIENYTNFDMLSNSNTVKALDSF